MLDERELVDSRKFEVNCKNGASRGMNAANLLTLVREQKPLVHCITNYVTANDCANAILAIGASPIMADDLREVADIVKISNALVLNIGTLNSNTVESMIAAGKKANALGIPVIFDPVGAGASAYRNETTQRLLHSVSMTVIRGNLSEVSFIAGLDVSTKGVDTAEEDSSKDPVAIANKVAKEFNCIAAITGAIDTVSDGNLVTRIENGTAELSRVTGTGCMTTALVAAFCGSVFAYSKHSTDGISHSATDFGAVYLSCIENCATVNFAKKSNKNASVQAATSKAAASSSAPPHSFSYFDAAVAGIASMGIAGEIAEAAVRERGTGSYRIAIIDALSKMNSETAKALRLKN